MGKLEKLIYVVHDRQRVEHCGDHDLEKMCSEICYTDINISLVLHMFWETFNFDFQGKN